MIKFFAVACLANPIVYASPDFVGKAYIESCYVACNPYYEPLERELTDEEMSGEVPLPGKGYTDSEWAGEHPIIGYDEDGAPIYAAQWVDQDGDGTIWILEDDGEVKEV